MPRVGPTIHGFETRVDSRPGGGVNEILGLDAQQMHDDGVRAELERVLAYKEQPRDNDIPFSIGKGVNIDYLTHS